MIRIMYMSRSRHRLFISKFAQTSRYVDFDMSRIRQDLKASLIMVTPLVLWRDDSSTLRDHAGVPC